MKTTKVFSSFKIISVGFAFSFFGIFSGLHPFDRTLLICGLFIGVGTLFSLYFKFRPCFSYNEQFLILGEGFWKTEKINWKDVISITTDDYIGQTFIKSKNNFTPISYMITPNYYQILEEVVGLYQRNNPNAKVDDETFKRLKKGYRRKQRYLLTFLIFLLALIWAMHRFHWFEIH